MKPQQIDIEVAIPEGELAENLYTTERKNALSVEIVEKHRTMADQTARAAGGRLRTDRMPEFYIRRGSDLVKGGDYLLTASRWWCEMPDSFEPSRAR